MDRGMNLRPVTMDFLFQAGVGCIGFYAKYSPFGLFEKIKVRKFTLFRWDCNCIYEKKDLACSDSTI